MKKLIVVCFLLMYLTSCSQNKKDVRQLFENDYKFKLGIFGSKLTNFFPKTLPDGVRNISATYLNDKLVKGCFGVGYIFLAAYYPNEEFNANKHKFDSISKAIYNPTDTTLILVFSYTDKIEIEGKIYDNGEDPERRLLAKKNVTTSTSLPIPLFEPDIYKGKAPYGLSEDFNMYVFDAKLGKFIKEEYLQECDCLPEKWKHGYSKGVALSEKQQIVIYWTIVW